MTNFQAEQEFLVETNSKIAPALAEQGIIIPEFMPEVRHIGELEGALRKYHGRFQRSQASRLKEVEEQDFVGAVLDFVGDAPALASPIAGEEGVLYMKPMASNERWRLILMHENGHLIERAANTQFAISLPNIPSLEKVAATHTKSEGFGVWFAYTMQKFGRYTQSVGDVLQTHKGLDPYVEGFNFMNYVASRFGPKAVFDLVMSGQQVPLEVLLQPQSYKPEEMQKEYAMAYLRTRDERFLQQIRDDFLLHFSAYSEKKGYFSTPFSDLPSSYMGYHKGGFLLEAITDEGPTALGFIRHKYTTCFEGKPFTQDFETRYLAKMTDTRVVNRLAEMGVGMVHLTAGRERETRIPVKPQILKYTPGSITMGDEYVLETPVEQILKDLSGPLEERA